MAITLDAALKERLRAVLDSRPVTEAELRKLAEEGRACALILGGRLERAEARLAEPTRDPDRSLAEIAATLRRVSELRPDLDELQAGGAKTLFTPRELPDFQAEPSSDAPG